ncbi:MAG: hypothetical protein ABS56_05125 [Lautropia sp. SCN 69-89]|nr:MAG: hypothetical protein ABS56_05125 [Lautropia sp. SCN 69-89]
MSRPGTVAVYFVASPLQYLAARRIAGEFERGARQVLVWYKPGLEGVVEPGEWDACSYMAWPRLEPLPGAFGRHRRLRENIRLVAGLVGPCERLILHSAVYDTEAINYFLRALPMTCGASEMRARILPDGLLSIRRYPLSPVKRLLQYPRKLRRLFAPELDYQCFGGDRIGSDARFCDRIYVVHGLPNEYPAGKVQVLPPLVDPIREGGPQSGERRALVIGQPLAAFRLMSPADVSDVASRMRQWLAREGFSQVDYKPHPKDSAHDLAHPDYRVIAPAGALESHMAQTPYDAVIGVRSSSLLLARQIYPDRVRVVAFGWQRVRFKSQQEREDMRRAFTACGVEFA